MSVLAAKCPCCGRDIGFEESVEEYTCVFCGAELKVSALKTEHLDPAQKKEEPGARQAKEEPKPDPDMFSHRHHHHREVRTADDIDPAEVGLTREEIEEHLKRKAEYKEELHAVVDQIDEFRARRPKLKARSKTVSTLSGVGIGLAVASAIAILLFADGESELNDVLLVVSGITAAVAVFMLVLSFIRRNDIKKQQSRLEETILEKKQKRDVLIGRINKINKTLHIHSK